MLRHKYDCLATAFEGRPHVIQGFCLIHVLQHVEHYHGVELVLDWLKMVRGLGINVHHAQIRLAERKGPLVMEIIRINIRGHI